MRHRLKFTTFCLLLSLFVAGASAQSKPDDSAFDRLSNARLFATGGIGFVGRTSQGEKDYRVILSQPDALLVLERLYEVGNPVAKAYALTGIRHLSRTKFDELYAALPSSDEEVTTMSGCVMSHKTLRDIAKRLALSPDSSK